MSTQQEELDALEEQIFNSTEEPAPPAPPAETPAEPAAAAEEPAPAAPPITKKWADKYDSPEHLELGYKELQSFSDQQYNTVKREAAAEIERLRAEIDDLKSRAHTPANERKIEAAEEEFDLMAALAEDPAAAIDRRIDQRMRQASGDNPALKAAMEKIERMESDRRMEDAIIKVGKEYTDFGEMAPFMGQIMENQRPFFDRMKKDQGEEAAIRWVYMAVRGSQADAIAERRAAKAIEEYETKRKTAPPAEKGQTPPAAAKRDEDLSLEEFEAKYNLA
jgi:hypothetical protein